MEDDLFVLTKGERLYFVIFLNVQKMEDHLFSSKADEI